MEMDLRNGELCLADNAPIRLRQARGLRVTCTAGQVWLTVDGEAGDIHLRPGESHVIAANGLALLEAIGCGRVHLAWPSARLFSVLPTIRHILATGFSRPSPAASL